MMIRSCEDRFWSKVRIIACGGCWEWLGTTATGYGRFYLESRVSVQAHRYSYELLVGSIPEGLYLDHLCRNRACVNPAHLEPVTPAENARRGAGGWMITHCPQGHPYNTENTYMRKDRQFARECRVCNRAAVARYQARRRGQAA